MRVKDTFGLKSVFEKENKTLRLKFGLGSVVDLDPLPMFGTEA